jgi:hypothetical protein
MHDCLRSLMFFTTWSSRGANFSLRNAHHPAQGKRVKRLHFFMGKALLTA